MTDTTADDENQALGPRFVVAMPLVACDQRCGASRRGDEEGILGSYNLYDALGGLGNRYA